MRWGKPWSTLITVLSGEAFAKYEQGPEFDPHAGKEEWGGKGQRRGKRWAVWKEN